MKVRNLQEKFLWGMKLFCFKKVYGKSLISIEKESSKQEYATQTQALPKQTQALPKQTQALPKQAQSSTIRQTELPIKWNEMTMKHKWNKNESYLYRGHSHRTCANMFENVFPSSYRHAYVCLDHLCALKYAFC